MQVGNENGCDLPNTGGTALESTVSNQKGSGNSVQLSDVDMRLFRALRKLNAPKQRICSALWLSYTEYDELLKQL